MNHRSEALRQSANGEACVNCGTCDGAVWLPCADGYEVSNYGGVRQSAYIDKNGHHRRPRHVATTAQARDWYLRVYLGHGRRVRKRHYVHQLVATAFLGVRPHGHVVNHKNGNKQDNRLANLEWVTQADNCRHALATNLTPVGAARGDARLTDEEVRRIRSLNANGVNYSQIARFFPVSRACIRKVCLRETWSHVQP